MPTPIRVRFAPSPTGALHIGGARTALYNFLFARQNRGSFVLRIEDTDIKRSTETSTEGITDALDWLGLNCDEGPVAGGKKGPYKQSERLSLYTKYLQKLIDENKAYYCFCSEKKLQLAREEAQRQKLNYRYDRTCCHLSDVEISDLRAAGNKPVIRLKVPQTGITSVKDIIRGIVKFQNELLDDFIIAKADGWPTYNFAVVVDDALMEISHIIRAEEHLSNTPKQILIYQALGWPLPEFAHISMILSPNRSKLSKRHGATSVQEFKEQGYLPEAIINYIALLGWSPGEDVNLLSQAELIRKFSLSNMTKAPAIYDIDKLTWMNGLYLNDKSSEELLKLVSAFDKNNVFQKDKDYSQKVINLIKSRCKLLPELVTESSYFFIAPNVYDKKGVNKYFSSPEVIRWLQEALALIVDCDVFTAEQLETSLRTRAEQLGIKAAQIIHPVRLSLSGRTNTPGIFEVMEILGAENCQIRIEHAIAYIKQLRSSNPADNADN